VSQQVPGRDQHEADRKPQGRAALPQIHLGDRALVWLATGPVGRGVAFALDLGAALARGGATQLKRRFTEQR
jgi:hypothetical protein